MSVTSCKEFFSLIEGSAELSRRVKAMTAIPELIALGGRYGFAFDASDVVAVSSGGEGPAVPPPAAEPSPRTSVLHHEFDVDAIPGLGPLVDELPALMVRPPDVDLKLFHRGFVPDDRMTLERAPDGPEFERGYAELHDSESAGGGRRGFHLVNLDDHVDHADYERYFEAKLRVVRILEDVLGGEVRSSGNLWYPPGAYRLWHTNETQPGWRMYLVALDREPASAEQAPFFRYRSPETGELVTLPERRRIVRFFRIEQEQDRLFWHCIANPGPAHRWSFGFAVPDRWWSRFPVTVG